MAARASYTQGSLFRTHIAQLLALVVVPALLAIVLCALLFIFCRCLGCGTVVFAAVLASSTLVTFEFAVDPPPPPMMPN